MERIIPDLTTRTQTANDLARQPGWDQRKAQAWADHTATTADEINRWDALGVTPKEARTVCAIAYEIDVDSVDYLDLNLDGPTTVAYAEAWITPDEARELEESGQRPDDATLKFMRGQKLDASEAAVKRLNKDLQADSDYDDLDDDLTW